MTYSDDDIRSVVTYLRDTLGSDLVGQVGSADAETIASWATGTASPSTDVAVRLRVTAEVVAALSQTSSPSAARAWLTGAHSSLGGQSPVDLLREANVTIARSTVLRAARS
ncbi:MAG: hypothetical protein ABWX59_04480 [Microbacteriaceae bacterium]